jgi:ABC-type multidrug transport system fused ATPase/permease subunit
MLEGMSMPMGGPMFRSFRQDPSVTNQKIARGTLRRIAGFARPYRGAIAVFLVLIALDAALGAATPLIYRAIIDRGITPGRLSVVVALAGVLAALALAAASLGLGERYLSARIGEGLIFDLRTKVFTHVQELSLAFFSRTHTGALTQRLNGDVLGAQRAFTSTLSSLVSNTLTVVFVIAAMVSMSWKITLLSLVLLPVFIAPVRWVGRKLAAIAREAMELNAAMSQTMTERFSVSGAALVKNYGDPARESAAYASDADAVRRVGIRSAMYGSAFRIGMTLVASIAVAVVYGFGGALAIRGELTVGVVVALVTLLNRLYGPITALSNVQVDVMTTLVSFDRVLEVLDLDPLVKDAPDAVDLIWPTPSRPGASAPAGPSGDGPPGDGAPGGADDAGFSPAHDATGRSPHAGYGKDGESALGAEGTAPDKAVPADGRTTRLDARAGYGRDGERMPGGEGTAPDKAVPAGGKATRRDARAGYGRNGERVLGGEGTASGGGEAPEVEAGEPAVQFREVWFRYPAGAEVSVSSLEGGAALAEEEPGWTLEDVAFDVPRGAMVALVGPSGAGKSTASLLVSRLYDATRGGVRLGGRDVRSLTAASIRRSVGVVAQDAHLFHATLRENLLFAKPEAAEGEIWQALERARAMFAADLPLGLETVVGDRGYRLSGGERQRIAIARLLLKAPQIVVLDEATAHLDSESELAVQRALAEALRGRTSLVIAHRLSTVRDADLIVVLDRGRVVERGTHAELLAAGGLYADLYRVQFAETRT